jgi:hypothetical protein
MSILLTIAEIAGCISAIAACIALFVKPIRERIFKVKKDNESEREGLKCLLRNEILKIYHRNKDSETIGQYEAENFIRLYEAYRALGGNSFVNEIYEIVVKWKVIK